MCLNGGREVDLEFLKHKKMKNGFEYQNIVLVSGGGDLKR